MINQLTLYLLYIFQFVKFVLRINIKINVFHWNNIIIKFKFKYKINKKK